MRDARSVFPLPLSLLFFFSSASKWTRPGSGLRITPIVTDAACFAPGEALRDVYTHGVVTGDFVLVFGDVVCTVRLDAVVRAHRARRRRDKDAVMTVVVKAAGVGEHRARCVVRFRFYFRCMRPARWVRMVTLCVCRPLGDAGVFVLDADTGECLHYEAVAGVPLKTGVRIPRGVLARHANVDVRNDLVDCGVDICSVEVRGVPRACRLIGLMPRGGCRCCRCSRTTLTIWISGGTLCTGF